MVSSDQPDYPSAVLRGRTAGRRAFAERYSDGLVAASAGVLTLCVYLSTIFPGVFMVGDAAKFTFVGKVLGIPHAPGYPLYVMVAHLFSYLPFGTLAYRMNAMSALLGATAVALLYLAGRTLGFERAVAVCAALACGLGHAFWAKALYAKTYTLNAALVVAGILVLLRWGHSRRPRLLYAAIGIFALSIGNHLIVIALLPALVMYVLLTDARTALSPRTLAITAGLVSAGLSQYVLIMLRTWQEAPYLEARATNLRELVSVVTARRWAHEIGAYPLGDLVSARVPVIAGLVTTELTVVGLCFVAAGLVVLLRRRPRDAALCLIGAFGVVALTTNMSSDEDQGFLLPAFALLWLLAGAGLQWVVCALRDLRGQSGRAGLAVGAAALAACVMLPLLQVITNYRRNDHHNRTFETRYFNALFDMLPLRSAILDDKYSTNMMIRYKLLGEDAAAGRDVVTVPVGSDTPNEKLTQGYEVFAFEEARSTLETLGYQFEPVRLFDVPLPQYLDVIGERRIVALAATPDVAAQLRANRRGWARLGVSHPTVFGQKIGAPIAIVGVTGAGTATESIGFPRASVTIPNGSVIGRTGTTAGFEITARADREQAVVTVGGIERARTSRGVALVVVDPRGAIEAYALEGSRNLRVPFDDQVLPLFRVTGGASCADVGNAGWQDISHVAARRMSVRIDNYRPYLSHTILYIAGNSPATPQLTYVSGRGFPQLSVQTFRTALTEDRDRLRLAAHSDGLQTSESLAASPVVSRLQLQVDDEGDHNAVRMDVDMEPAGTFVRAAVDLNNPRRATVCGMS